MKSTPITVATIAFALTACGLPNPSEEDRRVGVSETSSPDEASRLELTTGQVFGYFDGIQPLTTVTGGGMYGWACDNANLAAALTIYVYATGTEGWVGQSGVGKPPVPKCKMIDDKRACLIASGPANRERDDLGSACGGTTKHAFYFHTPGFLTDYQPHTVYAFATKAGDTLAEQAVRLKNSVSLRATSVVKEAFPFQQGLAGHLNPIKSRLYTMTTPVMKPGIFGVWSMYNTAAEPLGPFATAPDPGWDAVDYTGYGGTSNAYGSATRGGIRLQGSQTGTPTIAIVNDTRTAGGYIDFHNCKSCGKNGVDLAAYSINPVYNFDIAHDPILPWQNNSQTHVNFTANIAIPKAGFRLGCAPGHVCAAHVSMGLELRNINDGKGIWFMGQIFDPRDAAEWVSWDPIQNMLIVNSVLRPGGAYSILQPGSGTFKKEGFPRQFLGYTIDGDRLACALQNATALKLKDGQGKLVTFDANPAHWALQQIHINNEIDIQTPEDVGTIGTSVDGMTLRIYELREASPSVVHMDGP
jgi:hypothetical protein